jgi:hypothetical protein
MSCYGDGGLAGILSVDISSCFVPDDDGVRLVDEVSRDGILDRVLRQILVSLTPTVRRKLERSVFARHLDAEVRVGPDGVTNAGRLLVHPPGSRHQRPEAILSIPNLFLAADFVRTSMDLASMEGANEAGRRAARGALAHLGLDPAPVEIFSYDGLDNFRRLRAVDDWLHGAGMPHLWDIGSRAAGAMRTGLGSVLRAIMPDSRSGSASSRQPDGEGRQPPGLDVHQKPRHGPDAAVTPDPGNPPPLI